MSKEDIYKDEDGFSGDEKGKDAFGVPENYFDSFSSRLFKKIEAEDELKDYPLLASVGRVNPFVVPQDYFELREELLQYPSLRDLKSVRFVTPGDYFDEVTANVLNKIEVAEETKIYKALSSIEKQNVFAVPEKYFEEFAARIENETKGAKVISIFARVRTTYKVAMAAAVALIVTLSILYNNQTTQVQNDNECHTLACISKKEILNSNYIQSVSE